MWAIHIHACFVLALDFFYLINLFTHDFLLIRSHMNMGDLYVFDRFEAAAAAVLGSKIFTEIFVLRLQPTVLQASP